MMRLTFPKDKIDDNIYQMAHSIEGAERVAAMGFNWVHLVFSWGFPAEIEAPDWEVFKSAVRHYHEVGVRVLGIIQASNCVYQGSYKEKDWYALDPHGNKIYCYIGRYHTALHHPEWQAEIRERIRALAETEADGILFDSPWIGGVGYDVAGMPLGPIGSYDEHTRSAYARAHDGAELPLVLNTRSAEVKRYLRWRTTSTVAILAKWIEVARNLKPDFIIGLNNFDAIARNSFVTMGIDLPAMAALQDVVMIENFAWPHLQDDDTVAANAITIGAAQVRTGETPVTTRPGQRGIGHEQMWSPRSFRRAIVESTAIKAPIVVQGSGFRHRGEQTLILHSRYQQQRRVLKAMNSWLETHQEWLNARQPASPLAIYHPYEAARWDWNRVAPVFFAVCETLLLNGYPVRIVGDADSWEHVRTILVPPGHVDGLDERLRQFVINGGQVIPLTQKRPSVTRTVLWDGWRPLRTRLPRPRWFRRWVNQSAIISWNAYHRYGWARWLATRLKIREAMIRSPLYIKPPEALQRVLIGAIGEKFYPRVESEAPALLTVWNEANGGQQWHVVNYADKPQKITLHLGELTATDVHTPGSNEAPSQVVGSSLMFDLDVGKIIRVSNSQL